MLCIPAIAVVVEQHDERHLLAQGLTALPYLIGINRFVASNDAMPA
jgi:hypothetical protein